MSRLKVLRDRAHMMDTVRSFFKEKKVTETDVPILSSLASVDAHIDLIPASFSGHKTLYLHSSPEYGMKRLLSEGLGDIYQLSHVFRDGESGSKHSPEFMMAEWYRLGFSFQDMIDETLDFCRLFLGSKPALQMTYREMFKKFAGIDYVSLSQEDLARYLEKENIPAYSAIASEGKDGYLNLILTQKIEPLLGEEGFFVLTHYPASQAALAQTTLKDGERVAERFEVYYKGLELANGYHELADADEQERRLIAANEERQAMQKSSLPIDTLFLDALKKGLPPCSGVAVGFDRLMMLRHQTDNIKDVIAFGVQ